MQAAHPLVMAGVDQFDRFREDPWKRLYATVNWVLASTFADRETVDRAADRIRAAHRHVEGTDPVTGLAFAASDPDLLRWVHCTETDSYLTAYEEFVAHLDPDAADRYVAERVPVAALLGLHHDVPVHVRQLRAYLADMEPELLLSPPALEVRDLVLRSPLAAVFRPVAGIPGAAAVATLPSSIRQMYGLRWEPRKDRRARVRGRWFCRAGNLLPDPPYVRSARRGARSCPREESG